MADIHEKRWRDLQRAISRAGELTELVPWADADSRDSMRDLLVLVNEMVAIRMAYLGIEALGEERVLRVIQRHYEEHECGATVREIARALHCSERHAAYLVELLHARFKVICDRMLAELRYEPAMVRMPVLAGR